MTAKHPQVGDRYRDVGTAFRNAVWILSEVFTSRNGIEHARLTSASDGKECKTLAVSVMADPKRFVLEETEGLV
jgi:hypothetical protein